MVLQGGPVLSEIKMKKWCVITQVVLKVLWKKDTAEVTTDHFGMQVLADL